MINSVERFCLCAVMRYAALNAKAMAMHCCIVVKQMHVVDSLGTFP